MLTVTDSPGIASGRPNRSPRGRLLAAVRDPSNWRQADCRPAFRDAVNGTQLPLAARSWACWLADRFTPAGDFALNGGIAALIAVSPASRAQTYRYLAQLERLGLIERTGTTRCVGPGEYRRATIVRISAVIRQRSAPKPFTVPNRRPDVQLSQLRDTRSRTPSSGAVGVQPTDRRQRETGSEQIDERDRIAVDEHWPLCATSRSSLPSQRPGYEDNTDDPEVRRRLMLPPLEVLHAPRYTGPAVEPPF